MSLIYGHRNVNISDLYSAFYATSPGETLNFDDEMESTDDTFHGEAYYLLLAFDVILCQPVSGL